MQDRAVQSQLFSKMGYIAAMTLHLQQLVFLVLLMAGIRTPCAALISFVFLPARCHLPEGLH